MTGPRMTQLRCLFCKGFINSRVCKVNCRRCGALNVDCRHAGRPTNPYSRSHTTGTRLGRYAFKGMTGFA